LGFIDGLINLIRMEIKIKNIFNALKKNFCEEHLDKSLEICNNKNNEKRDIRLRRG
jgi:hypothetical protein